jgi:fluoroquinolone transport system permease protein
MKPLFIVTKQFLAEIWSDAMLAVMVFAPLLMGCLFRFGVPALEKFLCTRLAMNSIITPYYALFDLVLTMMTPMMFAFSGAMVILGENDSGMARAISVTPVGRSGYLLSRVGIPALLSVVWCVIIVMLFRLTPFTTPEIISLALISAILGIAVSLMVISLAKNKVEGLALTKLSGLALLGIPAAILVPAPAQYIAGILPSLWMTKAIMEGAFVWMLPGFVTAVLWCALFWRQFVRKLLG